MTKELLRASFNRAERTFFQSLASTLPVGLIVTPEMMQSANWNLLNIVLAWLVTAVIAGCCSMLTSIAKGLPEVEVTNDSCKHI